jgi:flagellar biosynthetic protein FliQ
VSLAELVSLAQRALFLSVLVSLPVLVVAALFGLVTAVFQAATQVHDAALAHFPKFLAVAIALAVAGPWMGRQVVEFTLYVFGAR